MLNIAVIFLAVAVAAISVNQIVSNLRAEELQLQLRQLRRRLKQKQRGQINSTRKKACYFYGGNYNGDVFHNKNRCIDYRINYDVCYNNL